MDEFCALYQAIVVTIFLAPAVFLNFDMVKITNAFKCQQIDESSTAEEQEEEESSDSDTL